MVSVGGGGVALDLGHGSDTPPVGEVIIDGVSAWSLGTAQRARLRNAKIGFVFQFYHLLPELSAIENVLLPGMIATPRGEWRSRRKVLHERALETLVHFGLDQRLKHRPGQLSGGEQQRVAIARALLMDPPILIADEPTGNLDTATGDRVLDLLFQEQERRKTALLLVTHDEGLARQCERVVQMEDGMIQADSKTVIPQ